MSTPPRFASAVRQLVAGIAGSVARTLGGSPSRRRRPFGVVGALTLLAGAAFAVSAATAAGPVISSTSATKVSSVSATFIAQLDPGGEPTTYHFEYGAAGPCDSNPCTSAPVPDVSAGAASGTVSVAQPIADLAPATTYHFRLLATNGSGAASSSDATFTTYAAGPSFSPCPNDAFRTGPSSRLPDCRAYEQASPIDKNGNDVRGGLETVQAAAAGDGATFVANGGLPGGDGAQDWVTFLATRGPSAWSTQGLFPPASFGSRVGLKGWTPDLAYSFSAAGAGQTGFQFLARRSSDRSVASLGSTAGQNLFFVGASSDDSHVFLESNQRLTPDAPTGVTNLYLWDRPTNTVSLAGVLPDSACATPPCVSAAGSFAAPFNWFEGTAGNLDRGGASLHYFTQELHDVSASGDSVFFVPRDDSGQLYLRTGLDGSAPTTLDISASQASSPDPNGQKPAIFMAATPAGSEAFFTSCEKLTDDSTAVSTSENLCNTTSQGQDLYRWQANGDGSCVDPAGCLTDLTVDSSDPLGAQVQGVLGTSVSGDYVYFAANGDLDGSGPATSGDCSGEAPRFRYAGQCNIYLWHAGATTLIARTADISTGGAFSDAANWQPGYLRPNANPAEPNGVSTARVSADGHTLLFRSQRQLTAYDNVTGTRCDASEVLCSEFYRFHTGDPIACVTCNPTGAPPFDFAPTVRSIVVGGVPGANTLATFSRRNLSSDGSRFFFETGDQLVAADTNGDHGCPSVGNGGNSVPSCQDVYEWEAPGSGSCTAQSDAFSAVDGGCLYLLSTGTGPNPSFFADASASGGDVFFFTRDPLVPQDGDGIQDVYDARVGGGLASQHETAPVPCAGDACQGVSAPAPAFGPLGSLSLLEADNAKPSAPILKATVLSRVARGSTFLLAVKVPAGGRVTISGAGTGTVSKSVANAGTYTLRVTLTAKERKLLARKRGLKLELRVVYAPTGGSASATSVSITVKPAPRRHAKRRTRLRAAGQSQGVAR